MEGYVISGFPTKFNWRKKFFSALFRKQCPTLVAILAARIAVPTAVTTPLAVEVA
jgi:hypothetical protein